MWDSQFTTLWEILKEKASTPPLVFLDIEGSCGELEEVGDLHPATGSGRSYISTLEQPPFTTPIQHWNIRPGFVPLLSLDHFSFEGKGYFTRHPLVPSPDTPGLTQG